MNKYWSSRNVFYLSYFRWKEVQDVEKRVKMEQEMIHQANPALLPDSHSDLWDLDLEVDGNVDLNKSWGWSSGFEMEHKML